MKHISYSQYNTYVSCPRSWYLGKIKQAEEKQTWYTPIGSAVHKMIEDYLDPEIGPALVKPESADLYFFPLIKRQLEVEPDMSKWLAGGSADAPIVEERALKRVQECFERALEFLSELEVWEVEYDASGTLPGLEIPIKAFVDVIGKHKKKGPVILDWKTGSTKPNNFQLETYAALLSVNESLYAHVGDFSGRYAMLKPGSSNTRFVDLSEVDAREVGEKYQGVYERMKQKLYPTQAGFNCGFCYQQDNCLVNAGHTDRAVYYDTAAEDGYPY